jgi:hypothetical protein
MHRQATVRAAAVASLVAAVLAHAAQAETINCKAIGSAPYTIPAPGVYCLTAEIDTSMAWGPAIDIQASGVVLDLNGHTLSNLNAGLGTAAIGIYALDRRNITIVNGTVSGYEIGVELASNAPYTASQGHVIQGLRVDQNRHYGILVMGRGILVRNNQVFATGGTTLSPNPWTYGIAVNGVSNRVIDNDVVNLPPSGSGVSFGIQFLDATDGFAVGNRITSATRGIQFTASGKYRDNVTRDVLQPYTGGTNAGNNQ